jgi:hypothetical protein
LCAEFTKLLDEDKIIDECEKFIKLSVVEINTMKNECRTIMASDDKCDRTKTQMCLELMYGEKSEMVENYRDRMCQEIAMEEFGEMLKLKTYADEVLRIARETPPNM